MTIDSRAWLSLLFILAMALPATAQVQRGPRFNRVTSVRREGEERPARAGRDFGAYTETSVREQSPADPLRAYTSRPTGHQAGNLTSSLGHPEARPTPAPPAPPERTATHSYYPALRSGQGPNRNVAARGHCTGSRGSFIARGGMGMGMGPAMSPR